MLATLEHLYGLPPLTNRDKTANHVEGLLSLATPRTDCPTTLDNPAVAIMRAAPEVGDIHQSLPDSGNVHGSLGILLKTDLELSRGDPTETAAIMDRFNGIKTSGRAGLCPRRSGESENSAGKPRRKTASAISCRQLAVDWLLRSGLCVPLGRCQYRPLFGPVCKYGLLAVAQTHPA